LRSVPNFIVTRHEAILFDVFRSQGDAWLNWPIKTAPLIADALGLTDIERLAAALTERVHRQLIELDDAPTSEAPQATAVGI
jgi:hypothetical protein